MKIKTLFILALGILLVTSASAQKSKKKKKKSSAPKLEVVEIKKQPPYDPPVPAYVNPPKNGSLFSDGARDIHLLIDFKARGVGDLVFVNVVETSSAEVASNASRSRDSGTVGGLTSLISAIPLGGAATAGSVVGDLGKRDYKGSGSTDRNSTVRARITARVIEVLPNGDLRIQAVKMVKINKETEQLAVTGIVRKKDIAADNSIPTVAIGDLRVEFNGKGIASKDNAPGWLYRLFDKLNPF
ncbi:MAG: flagellar basal body L-ring protein FlgH [Pyrinomonadaceae bacterium]|nr:flagellar basal body L-ring protein FlgH [Pyrinomonadaceae bacterium]